MGAFRGAVEVGAHAIETDVHLTRDGVVVLSHVRRLNRLPDNPDKTDNVYRTPHCRDALGSPTRS